MSVELAKTCTVSVSDAKNVTFGSFLPQQEGVFWCAWELGGNNYRFYTNIKEAEIF